ncbi:hypothetical protein RZ517_14945 [Roseovarius sp. S88]|uniref:Uncharacterized protein n=1 Tax=Roseovarius phycicola TaxID=3080976 RepID=A0ABZ2HGV8_9RHOB
MPRRYVVTQVEEHWVEDHEILTTSNRSLPIAVTSETQSSGTLRKVATAGLVLGVAALLIGAASGSGSSKNS